MEWVQDMTARWVAILSAAGGDGIPLDEAVRQLNVIFEAPAGKGRFGRLRRDAAGPAEASVVTVLCRQLIAGVLVSDLLLDQVCALAGQTRGQALGQLSGGQARQLRDRQLRALQAELSGSCTLLRDPERASYAALGDRIEHPARARGGTGLGAYRRGTSRSQPDQLLIWHATALSTVRAS